MEALGVLILIEAVLAAVLYVAAGREWERAGLYLLAQTAPLEVYRTGVAGVNLSLFRLSLLAVGTLLVLDLIQGNSLRRALVRMGTTRLSLTYLALAVVMAGSLALGTDNSFLGKRLLAMVLVGVVAIALIAEFARRVSVATLLRALAFGAVLPIVAASWQGLAPSLGTEGALPFLSSLPVEDGLQKTRFVTSTFGGSGVRVKGTFGDPNHYGVYLALVLVAALGLLVLALLKSQRSRVAAYAALAAAAGASLLATYSRTGWAAAAVATLTLAALLVPLVRARGLPGRSRVIAVSGAAVLTLALLPAGPGVLERLDPNSSINSVTNKGHRETAEVALEQFGERPILGIGPGGLGVVLDQGPRTSGAHSTFLTVAAELGIVGLFALLLAAAFALDLPARVFWRRRRDASTVAAATLLAAYVGFLVANLFQDVWWDDFHWVLLGGIVALVPPGSQPAVGYARAGQPAASR